VSIEYGLEDRMAVWMWCQMAVSINQSVNICIVQKHNVSNAL